MFRRKAGGQYKIGRNRFFPKSIPNSPLWNIISLKGQLYFFLEAWSVRNAQAATYHIVGRKIFVSAFQLEYVQDELWETYLIIFEDNVVCETYDERGTSHILRAPFPVCSYCLRALEDIQRFFSFPLEILHRAESLLLWRRNIVKQNLYCLQDSFYFMLFFNAFMRYCIFCWYLMRNCLSLNSIISK